MDYKEKIFWSVIWIVSFFITIYFSYLGDMFNIILSILMTVGVIPMFIGIRQRFLIDKKIARKDLEFSIHILLSLIIILIIGLLYAQFNETGITVPITSHYLLMDKSAEMFCKNQTYETNKQEISYDWYKDNCKTLGEQKQFIYNIWYLSNLTTNTSTINLTLNANVIFINGTIANYSQEFSDDLVICGSWFDKINKTENYDTGIYFEELGLVDSKCLLGYEICSKKLIRKGFICIEHINTDVYDLHTCIFYKDVSAICKTFDGTEVVLPNLKHKFFEVE